MKLREQPATHLIYDTIWEQILDDFAASKPRQSCSRDDRIIPIFRNGTGNGEPWAGAYNEERVVVVRSTGRPGWRRAQWRTTGSAAIPSPRDTAWNHTSGDPGRGRAADGRPSRSGHRVGCSSPCSRRQRSTAGAAARLAALYSSYSARPPRAAAGAGAQAGHIAAGSIERGFRRWKCERTGRLAPAASSEFWDRLGHEKQWSTRSESVNRASLRTHTVSAFKMERISFLLRVPNSVGCSTSPLFRFFFSNEPGMSFSELQILRMRCRDKY